MYRNITDPKQVAPITTHTSAEVSLVILVTINVPPFIVTSLEGLKFTCIFIQDLWDVSIFHNVYHIDRQEMFYYEMLPSSGIISLIFQLMQLLYTLLKSTKFTLQHLKTL